MPSPTLLRCSALAIIAGAPLAVAACNLMKTGAPDAGAAATTASASAPEAAAPAASAAPADTHPATTPGPTCEQSGPPACATQSMLERHSRQRELAVSQNGVVPEQLEFAAHPGRQTSTCGSHTGRPALQSPLPTHCTHVPCATRHRG